MHRTVGELPQDLKSLLEVSYQAVLADRSHELTFGRRVRILLAMGDHTSGPVIGSTGHRRRTTLGMLATRKVLPIWHQYWPDDHMPEFMLERSTEVLDQPITLKAGRDLIQEAQHHLSAISHQDNLSRRRETTSSDQNGLLQWEKRMNAMGAGEAATFTFCTAVSDEEVLIGGPYDLELADSDMDWDEHDPSYPAAIAYANGSVWRDYADIERRREFWHWWLFEAVPAAWASWPN